MVRVSASKNESFSLILVICLIFATVVLITSFPHSLYTTTDDSLITDKPHSSDHQTSLQASESSFKDTTTKKSFITSNPTADKSSSISLSSISTGSVNPQPGDNLSLTFNTGSSYLYININFTNFISATEINASVVYLVVFPNGNSTVLTSGSFIMNTTSLYIPSATGIPWKNTTSAFFIPTGLSIGSHLQIGSDPNATVVDEFDFSWLGLTYTVQNVTFIDGPSHVYSLFDKTTGIMLFYQQFESGSYGWLNSSSFITVNPVILENDPPTITNSGDVSYLEGATGYYITWIPVDANPYSYEIYRDTVLIDAGLWSSNSPITVNVDGLIGFSNYNFTLVVSDLGGLTTSNTVWVSVTSKDNFPPTIDSPADIEYEVGTPGVTISWTATDSNPGTYTVIRMDKVLISSYWTSGKKITVPVDGLAVGEYNYTIVVSDTKGLSASDTVFVKVTESAFSQSSSSSSSSNTTLSVPTPGFEFFMMAVAFSLALLARKQRH